MSLKTKLTPTWRFKFVNMFWNNIWSSRILKIFPNSIQILHVLRLVLQYRRFKIVFWLFSLFILWVFNSILDSVFILHVYHWCKFVLDFTVLNQIMISSLPFYYHFRKSMWDISTFQKLIVSAPSLACLKSWFERKSLC